MVFRSSLPPRSCRSSRRFSDLSLLPTSRSKRRLAMTAVSRRTTNPTPNQRDEVPCNATNNLSRGPSPNSFTTLMSYYSPSLLRTGAHDGSSSVDHADLSHRRCSFRRAFLLFVCLMAVVSLPCAPSGTGICAVILCILKLIPSGCDTTPWEEYPACCYYRGWLPGVANMMMGRICGRGACLDVAGHVKCIRDRETVAVFNMPFPTGSL